MFLISTEVVLTALVTNLKISLAVENKDIVRSLALLRFPNIDKKAPNRSVLSEWNVLLPIS